MTNSKPYFREGEIQNVLEMLDSGRGVAVIGRYGAGKSTFMRELFRYSQEHDIPASQRLYDGHRFTSAGGARQECDDLVRELLVANGGRIMLVDSGDYLYLPKGMRPRFSYNSPEYVEMKEALARPDRLEELAEQLAREEYDPDRIRVYDSEGKFLYSVGNYVRGPSEEDFRRMLREKEKNPNLQVPLNPRELFKEDARGDMNNQVTCFEQRARGMRELGWGVESGRVRAVLTYHSTFRLGKAGEGPYQPDFGLGVAFGMYLAPHLINFALPEAYEPDKARLYLKTVKGLQNPDLVEQVLRITGGVHALMKLSILGPNEDSFEVTLDPKIITPASELEKMTADQVERHFGSRVGLIERNDLNWE